MTTSCTPTPRSVGVTPTYRGPTPSRDRAVARQNRIIRDFLRDQFEHIRLVWDAPDQAEPVPPARRLMVRGSQGTGKTTTVLRELVRAWTPSAPWTVWFMVPTVAKAEEAERELAEEAERAGLPCPPTHVLRGRGAKRDGQEAMCVRPKAAAAAGNSGLPVGRTVCGSIAGDRRCPGFKGCAYRASMSRLKEMTGGVVFLVHEYLWLPVQGPAPDLLVVDESVIAKACERTELPLERVVSGPTDLADPGLAWPHGADLAAALQAADNLHQIRTRLGRDALLAMKDVLEQRQTVEREPITPDLDEETIVARINERPRSGRGALRRLLEAILVEVDSPRTTLNAVWTGTWRKPEGPIPFVACGGVKALTVPDSVPILLLDGTGDGFFNRRIFGDALEVETVAAPRDARVVQIVSRSFSRWSLTGTDKAGSPSSNKRSAEKLVKELVAFITSQTPTPVFVGTYKDVAAMLREMDLPEVEVGHFSALRGINRFKACQTAIIVGRPQPSSRDMEAQTRPFLAHDYEPLVSSADYVSEIRHIRLRNGGTYAFEVQVHPDPRVQRMLEQVREAEMLQAIDRVRPIFSHRRIVILSQVVLDVTVDQVLMWRDRTEGNRLLRVWERDGILPLSKTDLCKLGDGLFPTADAAGKALKEALDPLRADGEAPQIERLIGMDPPFLWVSYRRAGIGGRPATALVAQCHPDPRAALERALGVTLASFQVLAVVPEPVAPALAAE